MARFNLQNYLSSSGSLLFVNRYAQAALAAKDRPAPESGTKRRIFKGF